MFLVVAGPGYVFGLFAQVPPGRTEADIRAVLTRTLGTLTFGDEPFDDANWCDLCFFWAANHAKKRGSGQSDRQRSQTGISLRFSG